MTERGKLHGEREFRAATHDGELVGWLRDGPAAAPPVLLLHGGPGLNDYLQSLADELDGLFPIARYQQRGVAPSTESGPRDVETHVEDVAAVLDALGWSRAVVVGHSWGGHLVMHFAVAHPERLIGFVSIDPLGAVGDGGLAPFVEFLSSHVPDADRPRYDELESRERLTDAERQMTEQQSRWSSRITVVRAQLQSVAKSELPRDRISTERLGRRLPANSLFR